MKANSTETTKTWIVGTLELPNSANAEESTSLIVWMTTQGAVLNAEPCERVDAATLVESFEKTVKEPHVGKPGVPSSIRTASTQLAEWLHAHLGDRVELLVANTPELDGIAQTLRSFGALPTAQQGRPTYFSPQIEEQHVAGFFAAVASLYRAQPWRTVRSDTDVIGVRVPSLQIENAAAIVIGQNGQCYGVLVFPNYEGFVAYVTLAKAHATGVESNAKVEFISLNYERAQDLDPALRAEVKRFSWTVAGPMAYPWPIAVGENWSTRAVTLTELTLLGSLAEALPRFLSEARFQSSSVTRSSFKQNYRVDFAGKLIDMELEFPHSAEGGDDAA